MNRVRVALRSPVLATIAGALVLVLSISIWLLTDSRTSRSDALRTGGLAGGALVALYALWLNDRRRRVEEARQQIERQRHDLETDRISDERFARSVELLGNDADQVRVGALHALAGLARTRAAYRQTVIDILCAYLRRPFRHARWEEGRVEADPEIERELQVRLTAQRLLLDLLPAAGSDEPAYDLDLTGAAVEYLDLSGRKLGAVFPRHARLHSSTNLSDTEFTGPAWFTVASTGEGRLAGQFLCRRATFHARAWFSGTVFGARADFTGTAFAGEASFRDAVFADEALLGETSFADTVDLRYARFDGYLDLRYAHDPKAVSLYNTLIEPGRGADLPDGWTTVDLPDGRTRLTVPAP